jgi:hypothetical protein
MKRFLERYDDRIEGILSGFDRVVFRGSLTSIDYPAALQAWLNSQGILLQDCKGKFKELSKEIKEGGKALAERMEGVRVRHWVEENSIKGAHGNDAGAGVARI